jgi:single-strand DNA-binding protein
MSGWHQTIIVGNLGKSPDGREVNGKTVCNFSVAVSEVWNDRNGERQEKTTWYDVSVWGAQAVACYDHLDVGSQVMVIGNCAARAWQTEAGEARATLQLTAQRVQFLSRNQKENDSQNEPDYDESTLPF